MRVTTTLLPFAALSTAFVIPDEQLTNQIMAESKQSSPSFFERVQAKAHGIVSQVEDVASRVSENALDVAINTVDSARGNLLSYDSMTAFDGQGWLDSAHDFLADVGLDYGKHPKHGHHGHHGDDEHKPNKTVYQLIQESKYTTRFAKLINDYPDLIAALNGTAANYTVFAPIDKAFENLPPHHEKPSKELIKKVLAHHISADFFPAGRVLVTHTIPTIYGEGDLGGNPQRLRVGLGWKGLAVNFYARIIAVNIFGTNGVIHGVDSLIYPPYATAKLISVLPSEFSTLTLGLEKTGLIDKLAEPHHNGGTFFAPSNWAFQKIGIEKNMFLFSDKGKKCLEALLKYHYVPKQTLYSDAFYPTKDNNDDDPSDSVNGSIPKGKYHVDLATALDGKSLSVDIARFAGFISMKINGFADVSTQDGVARDGVVHIMSTVLIPPRNPGEVMEELTEAMSLEEMIERLDPAKVDL